MTDEVGRPAAANEDSIALLIWLTSEFNAPAGDVAATRAVMTLTPLDSELPTGAKDVADEIMLASVSVITEPRLLDTSVRTELELETRLTLPPKGDSDMKVGEEPSF